jgi:hypothetical protein
MPKANGHAVTARSKSRTTKKQPKREDIELRAYHIYLERGGAPGDPLEDWVRAERELLQANGKKTRIAKA